MSQKGSSISNGFYAGIVNTLILQPFDVIRTRQQQHHLPFVTTVKQIVSVNKLDLYKGLIPTLYRNALGYGAYFYCLKEYQKIMGNQLFSNVLTGCLARGTVGLAFAPLTFIKARFESSNYQYKSLKEAIKTIYRTEGWNAFYIALSTTLARDMLYSGIYFGAYNYFKTKDMPVYINASISALTGILITHPFDTIKTKMQLDPKHYPTVTATMRSMSMLKLFSGFTPRALRRIVQAIIAWSFYEAAM